METKKCSKCGEVKAVEEFRVSRARKCGRDFWCKRCRNEKQRAYRAKNRDKVNENHRRWLADNPGKATEYHRRDRERNPDSIKRRAKAGLEAKRNASRQARVDISDSYIRQIWGIEDKEGQESLVEAKRQQLLVHRELRKFQKLLKEQTK